MKMQMVQKNKFGFCDRGRSKGCNQPFWRARHSNLQNPYQQHLIFVILLHFFCWGAIAIYRKICDICDCNRQGSLLLILLVGSLLSKYSNFQQIYKKTQSILSKTQDRSDKVESRLKPNPTQGPKAKMTSNNQLSYW